MVQFLRSLCVTLPFFPLVSCVINGIVLHILAVMESEGERIFLLPCFFAWHELWELAAKDRVEHAKISPVAAVTTIATQRLFRFRSVLINANLQASSRLFDRIRQISKLI